MTREQALEWAREALEDISSNPQYTTDEEFIIIEDQVLPIIRKMIDEVSES